MLWIESNVTLIGFVRGFKPLFCNLFHDFQYDHFFIHIFKNTNLRYSKLDLSAIHSKLIFLCILHYIIFLLSTMYMYMIFMDTKYTNSVSIIQLIQIVPFHTVKQLIQIVPSQYYCTTYTTCCFFNLFNLHNRLKKNTLYINPVLIAWVTFTP